MSLKSRSVFKNFSAVFLSLFVIIAVFVPLESAKALELFSFDIFSSLVDWTAKLVDGDSSFMTTIYWFLYRMISLGLYVTTVFVYFGSWLIDIFLDENIYSTVLNMNNPASAVSIGWTTVRDACNTFFILFLLLIAFSTILRIQTYSAKSLLPKLIISLFLINFSAVIAMMVIDCGQVFMFEIKTWMGAGGFSGASGAGTSLTSIVDYFYNEYGWHKPPPSGEYLMEDVVGVAFAVVYSAILGCLYIMLALFLMVRVIVFVILIIISPFAFFSIILPGMRTYTSQWWQSLVSHAIFGPVFLFFIYLSGKMAQSMQVYTPSVTTPTEIAPLSHILTVLIPHVVAIGMLMAAIPVTQKLGVAGSSKIIGGVGGIGKVGIGAIAGAKLAGGGLKKAGGGVASRNDFVGRNVDKVKGGYYKVLEKGTLGLGRGAAMKGRASMEKSKEEKMKKLEVDFGDLKSIDLEVLEKKANGALGTTDDKALWLKAAAARGKLGENEDTAKKFMTGAERSLSGKEISEVTDKSLVLATHTSEAQRSGKKDEEIMREKMNDIVEDGKASKVQGLDNELAAKVWHDSQNSDQRRSSINSMSDKQRKELAGGYLKNANKEGVDEENKKEFSSNAVKLGEGLKESFAWGGNDAAAKIKEAFLEFDHKTVAKLSSDDLDKHGYSATDNQIKGLNKAGEYKTVRRIEASMEKHDPERYKREKNKPINPSPNKGSGSGGSSGGTKPKEPGKRWKEKMEEKTGGGGEAGGSGGSGEAANPKSNPKPNKSRKPFWKDESAEVGLTGGESSDEWLKEDLTPSEQRRSDSIEARQDKYWDNNLDRYDKTNEELNKGYKIEDSCKKDGSGIPKDVADKLKAAEEEWKNMVKEEGVFREEWKKLGEDVMNRKDASAKTKQEWPEIKETEQEKIVERRESVTKKGEKSSVVKSEITFDPVKMGEEGAEQIVKEAMKGISNDMTQKINNKIEVNSPQEAVDIDFEKIIDTDKIAEIVKKGIDIKDVEKTFKDVKKSFKEFKGNNNESSSTTVFDAGISASQKAFDKTLTIKDRKERDIKLATITKVMGEIKSGMKKQNRSSVKEDE